MNNLFFIIAQIVGILASLVSIAAYHKKKKEKILSNMILSNSLNLIHYLLLGAYSGCITKILAICRDTFIISKTKNKSLSSNMYLLIFILAYVISGIFTYNNIWSIFPLIAAIIYIIPVWNGNELTIKYAAFISYFIWLVYNIFVFSISGIILNVISIISTSIAIKNNKPRINKLLLKQA